MPNAILETSLGEIELTFLPDKAPGHVENFLKQAREGFYDGCTFHRVIPEFMIQGGDPNSREADRSRHGIGGPGYQIDAEFNDTSHARGVLSMARGPDPNSAGSQFFIVVGSHPDVAAGLDGQYTAFGTVERGIEIADQIVNSERDGNDNPLERVEMKVRVVEDA